MSTPQNNALSDKDFLDLQKLFNSHIPDSKSSVSLNEIKAIIITSVGADTKGIDVDLIASNVTSRLDKDGNGEISFKEFIKVFQSKEKGDEVIEDFKDGLLEYLHKSSPKQGGKSRETKAKGKSGFSVEELARLRELFNKEDIDGDSVITLDELKLFLDIEKDTGGISVDVDTTEYAKELMDKLDTNHDGSINFGEFVSGFSRGVEIQQESKIVKDFQAILERELVNIEHQVSSTEGVSISRENESDQGSESEESEWKTKYGKEKKQKMGVLKELEDLQEEYDSLKKEFELNKELARLNKKHEEELSQEIDSLKKKHELDLSDWNKRILQAVEERKKIEVGSLEKIKSLEYEIERVNRLKDANSLMIEEEKKQWLDDYEGRHRRELVEEREKRDAFWKDKLEIETRGFQETLKKVHAEWEERMTVERELLLNETRSFNPTTTTTTTNKTTSMTPPFSPPAIIIHRSASFQIDPPQNLPIKREGFAKGGFWDTFIHKFFKAIMFV